MRCWAFRGQALSLNIRHSHLLSLSTEDPEGSLQKVKDMGMEKMKEMGFDMSNGFDLESFKETAMTKLKDMGVPIGKRKRKKYDSVLCQNPLH